MKTKKRELSLEDSNLYKQNQNLLCCHYTKGQSTSQPFENGLFSMSGFSLFIGKALQRYK